MTRSVLAGLIGANIQKSLSPALFEDACAAAGIRGRYHLLDLDRLAERSLDDLVEAARSAGFAGVNITYPCKEAVLPLLDAVSDEASQIGAVNTVSIAADGKTTGYNTDRIGFQRAFAETFGPNAARGQSAVLVGAGGAGRAIAFALFDLGLQTLFVNDKSPDQARALVATLSAQFGPGRVHVEADAEAVLPKAAGVVNATPVGMLGFPGKPIPSSAITSRHWVADAIYTPLETEFIKAARGKNARVMGGAGMCIHQAAEAFRVFTGLPPDTHRMQRTFIAAAAIRDRILDVG